MKKLALGLLMLSISLTAFAAEVRYFTVPGSSNDGGQSFCDRVWPGSEYFGVRMGMGPYYYVACRK